MDLLKYADNVSFLNLLLCKNISVYCNQYQGENEGGFSERVHLSSIFAYGPLIFVMALLTFIFH